jgi:ubiquinone/menaquinone biosynthesis C-methylase UbiE
MADKMISNYKGTGGDTARNYGLSPAMKRDRFFLDIVPHTMTNGTVLDAGCGTADISLELASKYPNLRFICTDLQGVNVAIARELVTERGLNDRFRFIVCSADALAIDDKSVNIAFACGVFPYCEDPVKAVQQLLGKVKNGGLVRFGLCERPPGEWTPPDAKTDWGIGYRAVTPDQLHKISRLGKVTAYKNNDGIILIELRPNNKNDERDRTDSPGG